MKSLVNKQNVNPADSDYPFGDVRDKEINIAGTKWNRDTMSDYIQFFHKMVSAAGVTPNEQLDNEYNGWQLYEAFRKLTRPYKVYSAIATQTGTNAPVVTVLGFNDVGNIVWSRTSTGTYSGTLTGAFLASKTFTLINAGVPQADNFVITRGSDNNVAILSQNGTTLTDGLLLNTPFEIRVYD